jgi:hypothetical protein
MVAARKPQIVPYQSLNSAAVFGRDMVLGYAVVGLDSPGSGMGSLTDWCLDTPAGLGSVLGMGNQAGGDCMIGLDSAAGMDKVAGRDIGRDVGRGMDSSLGLDCCIAGGGSSGLI